ncbi:LutC/YkgG family protein [Desulfocurvus sp. DL9XJH121]
MNARESILTALEDALGAGTLGTGPAMSQAPAFGADDWALYKERADACGARYLGVASLAEAAASLRALIQEYEVKTALAWEHPDLDALGLKDILVDEGVALVPHDAPLEERAQVDMGITSAHAALPESGSVIVTARAETPRQTSLLPPVHVALVLPGKSVPTIPDLPPFIRSQADESGTLPSAMHFITGASTTADIEKTIVKGVHGPTVCVVLAVEA